MTQPLFFAFATPPFFIMIPLWNFKQSSDCPLEEGDLQAAGYTKLIISLLTLRLSPPILTPPPPPSSRPLPSLCQEVSRSGFTHRLTWCRDCSVAPGQLSRAGSFCLILPGEVDLLQMDQCQRCYPVLALPMVLYLIGTAAPKSLDKAFSWPGFHLLAFHVAFSIG